MQPSNNPGPVWRVRRSGTSFILRSISAALGVLWLTMPFAQAAEKTMSLVQRNQVSLPYPGSYSVQALAKLPRKAAMPKPVVIAKAKPAPKPSVMEIAEQGRPDPVLYQQLERITKRPEYSPLVGAVVGTGNSSDSRTNVRIGYGKMVADTSNTVGTKNGTRLEEPGCLYVKTTVNF